MSRRNWQARRWQGRKLRHPLLDPWHPDNWTDGQARAWSSEAQSCRAQAHWGQRGTRFWTRVDRSGECWIWQGRVADSGYGLYHGNCLGQNVAFAHQYAHLITKGPVPRGLVVMHECDTPLCVRPSHLKAGTQAENLARARALGRLTGGAKVPLKGDECSFAKLTTAQAQAVLDYWHAGFSQIVIAVITGIDRQLLWPIVHRRSWRHLQPGGQP